MSTHPNALVPSVAPAAVPSRAVAAVPSAAAQPLSPLAAALSTEQPPHDPVAFELGWDHARHGLVPPAALADGCAPLRHGWLAGRAAFGERCLRATPAARQWLQLRLRAWRRGRSVELFQVTPAYLRQIEVTHCPVTRAELGGPVPGSEPSIDRVRDAAGYAAGNLALLSRRANAAKGALDFAAAMQVVRRLEDRPLREVEGLGAAAWRRIAVLCSFVEPLPHEAACTLPLQLLPPKRLHLMNPVQALQAQLSLQLMRPGWAERSRRFEALLAGAPLRRAYQAFFHALLPRVLEAAPPAVRQARDAADRRRLRWAIEDAWQHPAVLVRWTAFARQLDAAGCEALLARLDALGLGAQRTARLSEAQATEGWQLDSAGFDPRLDGRPRPGLARLRRRGRLEGGDAGADPAAPRTAPWPAATVEASGQACLPM